MNEQLIIDFLELETFCLELLVRPASPLIRFDFNTEEGPKKKYHPLFIEFCPKRRIIIVLLQSNGCSSLHMYEAFVIDRARTYHSKLGGRIAEGDKYEDCANPENYPLIFSCHFETEARSFLYSELFGFVVVGLSGGAVEVFKLSVDNEGCLDYQEQSEQLKLGHLTIKKAVRRVTETEENLGYDEGESEEEEKTQEQLIEELMSGEIVGETEQPERMRIAKYFNTQMQQGITGMDIDATNACLYTITKQSYVYITDLNDKEHVQAIKLHSCALTSMVLRSEER